MNRKISKRFTTQSPWRLGMLALLGVLVGAACSTQPGQLRVEDPWSRPASVGAGAVYLQLVNESPTDDRLIGVSSEVSEFTEIHRTSMDGQRMRMEPIADGVEIAMGDTVSFEPGGYHVMLLGLRQALRPGDSFELTLEFRDSPAQTVTVQVRTE